MNWPFQLRLWQRSMPMLVNPGSSMLYLSDCGHEQRALHGDARQLHLIAILAERRGAFQRRFASVRGYCLRDGFARQRRLRLGRDPRRGRHVPSTMRALETVSPIIFKTTEAVANGQSSASF